MARILIVSNRLPITVRVEEGEVRVDQSTGGLATGLRGPHERSGGLWIGWPGYSEGLSAPQQQELDRRLAELRVIPVPLSRDEVQRYYEGYCNDVIWPLFHYFIGQLPLHVPDFDVYQRVNERFADAVARVYQPGDLIWVHDYQLMLVPQLLRERLPQARIGFFLHIPFPSSEAFRTLPQRERLMEGLLGADLIGFHTAAYMRHFASSVMRVLGRGTDVDRIRWEGRGVKLGVFPMGIDAAHFEEMGQSQDVLAHVEQLRNGGEAQILVGLDRLDYTKGVPRRLMAFERLLQKHPELRERVRLIQVAVPSRTNVGAYQELREQVDGLIGRIHGEFATPNWVPVHYMFRSLSERDVAALYRAADVMLVTPIRDGMNLVAKEFVATRSDEEGVLVLSEFAGAASELAEAIHTNPYDVEGSADAFQRALTMAPDERRTRMNALRQRVMAYDVHRWVNTFLDELDKAPPSEPPTLTMTPQEELQALLEKTRSAEHLILLLDYDGTLVPFASTPELARPDDALLSLLADLTQRPRTELHVVSGRSRQTLEKWLGHLDLGLHAEHGFWTRDPHSREWAAWETGTPMTWREPVLAILKDFAARTPGSLVEEKTAGIAWHYRMADLEYGAFQANELRAHLTAMLANSPVEILPGQKVIEVRPHGANKGRIVGPVVEKAPASHFLMAMGDDRTDEDMFAALPEGAVSIHVGAQQSIAKVRLTDVRAARGFIGSILDGR